MGEVQRSDRGKNQLKKPKFTASEVRKSQIQQISKPKPILAPRTNNVEKVISKSPKHNSLSSQRDLANFSRKLNLREEIFDKNTQSFNEFFIGLQNHEVREELMTSHNVECPNQIIDGFFAFEELECLISAFKDYKNVSSPKEKTLKEDELINLLRKFYDYGKISDFSIHEDEYIKDYKREFLEPSFKKKGIANSGDINASNLNKAVNIFTNSRLEDIDSLVDKSNKNVFLLEYLNNPELQNVHGVNQMILKKSKEILSSLRGNLLIHQISFGNQYRPLVKIVQELKSEFLSSYKHGSTGKEEAKTDIYKKESKSQKAFSQRVMPMIKKQLEHIKDNVSPIIENLDAFEVYSNNKEESYKFSAFIDDLIEIRNPIYFIQALDLFDEKYLIPVITRLNMLIEDDSKISSKTNYDPELKIAMQFSEYNLLNDLLINSEAGEGKRIHLPHIENKITDLKKEINKYFAIYFTEKLVSNTSIAKTNSPIPNNIHLTDQDDSINYKEIYAFWDAVTADPALDKESQEIFNKRNYKIDWNNTKIDPRKAQDTNQRQLPNSAFYSDGNYAEERTNIALDLMAKDLKDYGVDMKIVTSPRFGFLDVVMKADALIVLNELDNKKNKLATANSKYSSLLDKIKGKGQILIPLQVKTNADKVYDSKRASPYLMHISTDDKNLYSKTNSLSNSLIDSLNEYLDDYQNLWHEDRKFNITLPSNIKEVLNYESCNINDLVDIAKENLESLNTFLGNFLKSNVQNDCDSENLIRPGHAHKFDLEAIKAFLKPASSA